MAYRLHSLERGRWIEVQKPTQEDLTFLQKELTNAHPTHLEDSLLRVQRPKLDIVPEYVFISDTIPIEIGRDQRTINFEVSMFLTTDTIVTITHQESSIFIKENAEEDVVATTTLPHTPPLLAYRFFEVLYDRSGQLISKIDRSIERIDRSLLDTSSPSLIREISLLQRNIIYFITSINASIPYFEELENRNLSFGETSMKEYWGDLVDKLRQQRDHLTDIDQLLTKLAQAHQNVISYHTNYIINVLTIFSVILLPLNLIAGIYGMNFLHLPGDAHPLGFYLTIASMVVISVAMLVYFKRKRWL